MESLLKELGDGTIKPEETGELAAEQKEQERVFKDAWTEIMDNMEPAVSTSTSTTLASADQSSQKGGEGSFQDRVKQTMDKMKEGQSSLKVRDPTTESRQRHSSEQSSDVGGNPDLEAFLSSLDNVEGDGETEEGLQGFLETMMSQLMSKEVLYEPLKEMHGKVCKFINSIHQSTLTMWTVPQLSH